jgi:hypothetical protein
LTNSEEPLEQYGEFVGLDKMEHTDFQNPIDTDKITDTPHTLPYPHHAGSAIVKPEDQGKITGRALSAMEQQTDMQLNQLYEQMHLLAEQAKRLQQRKTISELIYRAEIRFEPLVNHTYHLFKGEKINFLSMIAPYQWGRTKKDFHFLATVRLLADHTWEIIDKSEHCEF